MTDKGASIAVRLGILASSLTGGNALRDALKADGMEIVVEETLSGFLSDVGNHNRVNVLLVDLEGATDEDLDVLDALLEHSPLPMVFVEENARPDNAKWLGRLIAKIEEEAANGPQPSEAEPLLAVDDFLEIDPELESAIDVASDDPLFGMGDESEFVTAEHYPDEGETGLEGIQIDEVAGAPPESTLVPAMRHQRVWVLGASFGGPEALKRFLTAMPAIPNAAFIIAQHIGDGFVDVLASQLNRSTKFHVTPAANGAQLENGKILVAPTRETVNIDPSGRVFLRPDKINRPYTPSIDAVMKEVAERFGANSGAIIFSGMGDDGAEGCRHIARAGGVIWAQDSASCAIDSMPNCARKTGTVRRNGSPEALAHALVQHMNALDAQETG